MVVKLDFNECLKDSPLFRKNLCKAECDLESFENVYRKISESSLLFFQDGIRYLESYKRLFESFELLNGVVVEKDEEFTRKKIVNFCSLLHDSRQAEHNFLIESFKSISEKVSKFLDSDMKQLKEQRKQFERLSVELESAYVKNSETPKTKPAVCEEMERNLCGVKKSFGHASLDYISHVNTFYLVRSHSILDMIQLFSQSLKSFYQYGNVLVQEHDTELADISTNLCLMNENEKKYLEKMELQHDLLRSNISKEPPQDYTTTSSVQLSQQSGTSVSIYLSGYLFKRSRNNTFKKWNRRWFTLINSKLFYQKKHDYNEVCQIESDLRVCKVRETNDTERRFTFEIVSPKCRHILQADSQRECALWVRTIDKAINDALNNCVNNITAMNTSNNGSSCSSNCVSNKNSSFNNLNDTNGNGSTNTPFDDDSLNDANNSEFFDSVEFFNMLNTTDSTSISNKSDINISHNLIKNEQRINESKNFLLTTVKGNQICCDCGAPNPSWVSINLGCLLCIECSGKHRGLGVHISKVRSLHLDDLDNETLSLLMCIGNEQVNKIYECMAPKLENGLVLNDHNGEINTEFLAVERADPKCESSVRENWIKSKYLRKLFLKPLQKKAKLRVSVRNLKNTNPIEANNFTLELLDADDVDASTEPNQPNDSTSHLCVENVNELLHIASSYGDVNLIMYALALDADRNSILDKPENYIKTNADSHFKNKLTGYTPLIRAVHSGFVPAVELLILNGAKLNAHDFQGQTALHHATILNNLKLVCLLLKRGADPLVVDKNNVDSIQIASENCQPNIVTILRVAKMNNDLKEQDMAYSGDPMFDEILNDLLSLNSNRNDSNSQSHSDSSLSDQSNISIKLNPVSS